MEPSRRTHVPSDTTNETPNNNMEAKLIPDNEAGDVRVGSPVINSDHYLDLVNANTRLQSQVEVLSNNASMFLKERAELQSRLAQLEARNRAFDASLHSVISARDEAVAELSQFRSHLRPTETRLQQLEWELQMKSRDCDMKDRKLDHAQQLTEEFRKKACELEVERDEQEGVVAALKNKISAFQVQLEDARQEKLRSTDPSPRLNSVMVERDSLAEQLSKTKKDQLQLRTDLQRLVDERLEDRLKMDVVRKENATLSQKISDLQHTALKEKTNFLKQLEKVENEQRHREVEFLRQNIERAGMKGSNGSKVLSEGEWKRISELVARTDVLEVELTSARSEVQSLRETMLTVEHERKEFSRRIVVADKSLQERDSTIEFLTGRLEAVNARMKEVMDRQTTFDETQERIKLFGVEITELRSSKATLLQQQETVMEKARKSQELLMAAQRETKETQAEMNRIKNELTAVSTELSLANSQITEMTERENILAKEKEMLLQVRNRHQLELSALSVKVAEVDNLQRDLSLAREQENIWKQHAVAWQGYSEQLAIKPAVSEKQSQTDAERVADGVILRIAELESEVKAKEDSEALLHGVVEEHKKRLTEFENRLDEMEVEKTTRDVGVAELEAELSILRSTLEEQKHVAVQHLDTISLLTNQCSSLEKEAESQLQAREALQAEFQTLQIHLDTVEKEISSSHETNASVSASLSTAIQQDEELAKSQQLETLRLQLLSAAAENQHLQEQLDGLRGLATPPNFSVDPTVVVVLEQKILIMESERKTLEQKFEAYVAEMETSAAQRDEQWRLYYCSQQDTLEQRIAVLTEENGKLTKEIQKLSDNIQKDASSNPLSILAGEGVSSEDYSALLAEKISVEEELVWLREKVAFLEAEFSLARNAIQMQPSAILPVSDISEHPQNDHNPEKKRIVILEQQLQEFITTTKQKADEYSAVVAANALLQRRLQEFEEYVRDLDAKRQTDDQKVFETLQQQSSIVSELNLLREKYRLSEEERVSLLQQMNDATLTASPMLHDNVKQQLEKRIETLEADVRNFSVATSEWQEKYFNLQNLLESGSPATPSSSTALSPLPENGVQDSDLIKSSVPKAKKDLKQRIAKLRKQGEMKKGHMETIPDVVSVVPDDTSAAVGDEAPMPALIASLEDEKLALQTRVRSLEDALMKAHDECAVMSSSFSTLQQQFTQMQSEGKAVLEYSNTSSPAPSVTEESVDWSGKNPRGKIDLKQRISKLRDLKKQKQVDVVAVEYLQQREPLSVDSEREQERKNFDYVIENLTRLNDSLTDRLAKLEDKNAALEDQLAAVRSTASDRTAILEGSLAKAEEKYATVQSQYSALQKEHGDYIAQLSSDLLARDEQWNKFMADEKSEHKMAVDQLQLMNSALLEQISNLENESRRLVDLAAETGNSGKTRLEASVQHEVALTTESNRTADLERKLLEASQKCAKTELDYSMLQKEYDNYVAQATGDVVSRDEHWNKFVSDQKSEYERILHDMYEKSGALSEQIARLEVENNHLREQVSKNIETVNANETSASLEMSAATQRLEFLEVERVQFLKDIEVLQQTMAMQQNYSVTGEAELVQLRHNLTNLQDENNVLEGQLEALRAYIQAREESIGHDSEIRNRESALLASQLKEAVQHAESLESERTKLLSDFESLQHTVDMHQSSAVSVAQTNEAAVLEVEHLRRKLTDTIQQNTLLAEELEKMKVQLKEHEEHAAVTDQQIGQWEAYISEQDRTNELKVTEAVRQLTSQLEDVLRINSENQLDKQNFLEVIASLQKQCQELEIERSQLINSHEEKITEMNSIVQQHDEEWKKFLLSQTEVMERENTRLTEEMASFKAQLDNLSALQERCDALENSLNVANQTETDVRSQLHTSQSEILEMKEAYSAHVEAMNKSVAQHNQEYQDYIALQNTRFEEEKQKLSAEIVELQAYVAVLNSQMNTDGSGRERTEISTVVEAMDDRESEHLRAENDRLMKEVIALSERLAAATQNSKENQQLVDAVPSLANTRAVRQQSPVAFTSMHLQPTVQSKFAVNFDPSPSIFDEIFVRDSGAANNAGDFARQFSDVPASDAIQATRLEDAEMTNRLSELTRQLTESSTRITQLEEKLQKSAADEINFQNISNTVRQLEFDLHQTKSEMAHVQQGKDDLESKIEILEAELFRFRKTAESQVQSTEDATQSEVQRLSSELQLAECKVALLDVEISRLEKLLHEKDTERAVELAAMSDQLAANRAEYEIQVHQFQQEWESYFSERTSSLETENAALKKQMADLISTASNRQYTETEQSCQTETVGHGGTDVWNNFAADVNNLPLNMESPSSEYAQTMDIFERTIEELTKQPAGCIACDRLAEQLKATETQLDALSSEIEKLHQQSASDSALSHENDCLREKILAYEELLSGGENGEVVKDLATDDFEDVIGLKEDRMRLQVELLAVQEELEMLRNNSDVGLTFPPLRDVPEKISVDATTQKDWDIRVAESQTDAVESGEDMRLTIQNWIDYAGQLESQCSDLSVNIASLEQQKIVYERECSEEINRQVKEQAFLLSEQLRISEDEREYFRRQLMNPEAIARHEVQCQTEIDDHDDVIIYQSTIRQLEQRIVSAEEEIIQSRTMSEEIAASWASMYQAAQEELVLLRNEMDKPKDNETLDRMQNLTVELQKASGKNLALEQLNSALQQQITFTEAQLNEKESQFAINKQELEESRIHLVQLKIKVEMEKEGLIARVEFLEGEMVRKEEVAAELRDQIMYLQREVDAGRLKIEDLEHQAESRSKKIEEKQRRIQELRAEIKRLREELSGLKSALDEMDQKRKTVEMENAGLHVQNANLEQENKILSEEVERRQVLHDAFRTRVSQEASLLDEEIQGLRDHLQANSRI
ncbi:golgin subfamily B member 1-like isoform X2 [Paramacrobiotus metropolitanus]|uniref:golgin subfamily B member 1-like isoform X2 n=1 Tax=Paramacrobiotus metropolitanus TaxID=2943436 RepID=UPI002446445D|nr:golgin subfamily B member 1-like isoform X2 [Paramacrobiotus metropolitanus]